MTKRTAEAHQDDVAITDQPDEASTAPRDDRMNDMVVGRAEPKTRGLFGLGRPTGADAPQVSGEISRDNRALLQEALFDLLECKRLLDQSR